MIKKIHVKGYEAFNKTVEDSSGDQILAIFCGSKNEAGESWCSDCVASEPVVNEALKNSEADAIFIYCEVGDREFWKNQENPFRKDPILKLTAVPTLIKLGTKERLVEDQCSNPSLVEMIFE